LGFRASHALLVVQRTSRRRVPNGFAHDGFRICAGWNKPEARPLHRQLHFPIFSGPYFQEVFMQTKIESTEARQTRKGSGVRYILGASFALAVLAMILLMLFWM
jgi:hypothetical protein